ncbi:MAG: hypothetical protein FJZ56_02850 [Chlamydiae bacterium]|nr:hypothetical protein [Chlamydiota bacterium]
MKYKDLSSFENHIKKSFPDHVSQAFLFSIPVKDERDFMIENLVKRLTHFFPSLDMWSYDKERHSIRDLSEKLSSNSLFHQGTLFVFDNLEDLDQQALDLIKKVIEKGEKDSFYILASSSAKGKIASLYTDLKKELISLDLTEEKPWHRKERIVSELYAYAKRSSKVLEPVLVERLITVCQLNLKLLFSTLDRCIVFSGKKECLTLQDLQTILPSDPEERMWDLAEKLVWSKQIVHIDDNDWLSFLGAVRYQIQLGMKILSRKNPGVEDFPKINKNRFPDYVKTAKELGLPFFKEALIYLFELEVDAKTYLDPKKALDLLIFYFQQKRSYAPSIT